MNFDSIISIINTLAYYITIIIGVLFVMAFLLIDSLASDSKIGLFKHIVRNN
jgi:uncharacterized membrane protein